VLCAINVRRAHIINQSGQINRCIMVINITEKLRKSNLLAVGKRLQREELPLSNKACELINMVENNASAVCFISVENKKLPAQDTSLCMLHCVLPHPVGHSTPEDLHCEQQNKKQKMGNDQTQRKNMK
jgi:hypothetical protein